MASMLHSMEELSIQKTQGELNKLKGRIEQKELDSFDEGEFFDFGMVTVTDSDAKDSRPDITVVHLVGGTIEQPTIEYVRSKTKGAEGVDEIMRLRTLLSQYAARAGIKIIHRCGLLIGEFKRSPPRGDADIVGVTEILEIQTEDVPDADEDTFNPTTGESWEGSLLALLSEAIEDTMRYCAVHFLIYPTAVEVIALASAGPFWKWATIRRGDVPEYEWLEEVPRTDEKNEKLRNDFGGHFGPEFFILATRQSDAEINKMRDVMFTLINQSHQEYPPSPTDLNFTLIPDEPKLQYQYQ
ncbi:uncharacterized protein LACBIDRAFT_326653 [Laccaria bicolor S238N-H82]|uniref:Predicted protein n=1 Tax=Laccaria bicolor (strain S238N-H82 / ATCC MYA-4686) TaxID=486041 RepID=B0D9C7_LACBS|nr:uncharacterized protein LACBIDRAFT_326653 [Laccaria bicolor S238N-H82]EDR09224.1 predicted protein [Laccaria bicolor S238N-H82]|eukprot:XP_001880537.1 predicted protein [Laccaria bicolor S238N-H82]